MKILITVASASLVSLAIMSPSYAADESPEPRTVQFADLDLSKEEGAAALFLRIRRAARTVCERHNSRELARQRRYIDCIDFAISNAVARVDEPMLTEYFAKHSVPGQKATARIASSR